MIDIHCHLIYGVDDGASNLKDSLRMLSEAEKVGIRKIISTTHYHDDLYWSEKQKQKFRKLANRALDFGIELKSGYEVYISENSYKIADKNTLLTLNNSQYMLIEFPFSEFPVSTFETLYKLHLKGITPIISHPERCRFFIENMNVLYNFIQTGFLIQIDAASILGVYGRHAKKVSKELIKTKKANFIASNAHFPDDLSDWYLKAYNQVKKWAGIEYTESVFKTNAEVIINKSSMDYFSSSDTKGVY